MLIENIVSVFDRATQDEVDNGISWYPTAHRLAIEIADGNVIKGAGVISALSPLKNWTLNQTLAIRAFQNGEATGHTKVQNAKANAILALDNPTIDEVLVILSGEKTRNFFLNIVNPWGDNVTIDRHAHDIAMGAIFDDKTRKIGKARYAEFTEAYKAAALMCGVFPLELQAITWVAWRREKGIK